MATKPEGIGIAILLVLLAIIASPGVNAKPGTPKNNAVTSGKTSTCAPNLAGADYVGGVDVEGNRVAPADIGGGDSVDLSQISATPVLVPDRHGRHFEFVVQGVKPAKSAPGCKRQPR